MTDHIVKKLAHIKRNTDSIKRRMGTYSDLINIVKMDTPSALSSLRKASAPGKKLQRMGFIMLFIPEPTGATCAVGAPMILAGKFLEKKFNSSTITDIGLETSRTINDINNTKNSLR